MHKVIITYDKYADNYQVVVDVRKKFLFFNYWWQIKCYRGPLVWTCRKAVSLADQYGVEVIDRCPDERKIKSK